MIKGTWERTPLFGRVKASVTIGYFDRQGELVNKTQIGELWIIPWKLMTIIAISLGLLISLIWLLRKRYRFKIERK